MPTCDIHQNQMLEYVFDLLEDADRQALQEHLTGCARCRSAANRRLNESATPSANGNSSSLSPAPASSSPAHRPSSKSRRSTSTTSRPKPRCGLMSPP